MVVIILGTDRDLKLVPGCSPSVGSTFLDRLFFLLLLLFKGPIDQSVEGLIIVVEDYPLDLPLSLVGSHEPLLLVV